MLAVPSRRGAGHSIAPAVMPAGKSHVTRGGSPESPRSTAFRRQAPTSRAGWGRLRLPRGAHTAPGRQRTKQAPREKWRAVYAMTYFFRRVNRPAWFSHLTVRPSFQFHRQIFDERMCIVSGLNDIRWRGLATFPKERGRRVELLRESIVSGASKW